MELRDIAYVLAVCRHLNVTRAAQECGVAQPTLTRAVQKLEREFGGALVVRERGRTHLAGLGRLVQPRLEELLSRSQALKDAAHRHARQDGVDLRIGIMCSIGPRRLAGLLSRFRAERPGVQIHLGDATPERLAGRLLGGEFDAAITVQPAGFACFVEALRRTLGQRVTMRRPHRNHARCGLEAAARRDGRSPRRDPAASLGVTG